MKSPLRMLRLEDDPADARLIGSARGAGKPRQGAGGATKSALERKNPRGVPILNNFVSGGYELRR